MQVVKRRLGNVAFSGQPATLPLASLNRDSGHYAGCLTASVAAVAAAVVAAVVVAAAERTMAADNLPAHDPVVRNCPGRGDVRGAFTDDEPQTLI